MATKTIGTGGDYTSYASYITYLQTLGTLSAPEIGKQKNEELTVTNIDFAGFTPTATNTWTLEADTGASFRDHANKATNGLRYNAANGAAIKQTANYGVAVKVSVPYATVRNLQIISTGNAQGLQSDFNIGNITFDNLIIQVVGYNGGASVSVRGSGDRIRNSIIIVDSSNTQLPISMELGASAHFCTFVRPSNYTLGADMCESKYGTATFNNCVWSGFNNTQLGGGSITGTNNATDQGSFPTGLSGQTGLTPSTEFEQPSNSGGAMDFRLKSTSVKCKDNAATDATNGAADIIGTARPQGSAYDIGAWELAAASSRSIDASQAIPAFTSAAAGAVTVKASAAQTIAAFANTDTIQVIDKIAAAQTIPDFAQSAVLGAGAAQLAAAQTVPNFTQAASAAVFEILAASQAIPAFGQSAAAVGVPAIAASQTIPDFASVAAATVTSHATAAQTIAAFTNDGTFDTGTAVPIGGWPPPYRRRKRR